MRAEVWVKTSLLDDETAIDTEVTIRAEQVTLTRDELVRFLMEAGYTPDPDEEDP